ncbi:MAG TPA: zinc ABC transporter substrate-binding protein [Pseudomonadales bacterium]|nr:zinc ABC transporter substrate-binding protein [Pseudomonadales bacterium]
MKNLLRLFAILASGLISAQAFATLNVLTCEPEWAALTNELGGDKVNAASATTALQDPHRIEARPSLIAKARKADLLVCTGLELETGWLPILLQQAGNNKINAGQPGYFEAGNYVAKRDIPSQLDRSEGDVHAQGNPHIQTSPLSIKQIAPALTQRLIEIDSANANFYQNRLTDFQSRWNAALAKWQKQTAPLKGVRIVEHHKNFEYLWDWLGMTVTGTLEPKPGVEPSATHLAELTTQLQSQPAKMVVRAAYQDEQASLWLSEHAHIPAVTLPFTVGGDAQTTNLFELYERTISLLLDTNK